MQPTTKINFLGCLVLVLTLLTTPLLALADHHGTRCRIDFEQNRQALTSLVVNNACHRVLSRRVINKTIKQNIKYLKHLGYKRPHAKQVPIEGAAYSMPYSFSTCQIVLHHRCCPALKWCYPYKFNVRTATCGKAEVALKCEAERKRCLANPKLPECVQPPAKQERCLVNPKLPGCKKWR